MNKTFLYRFIVAILLGISVISCDKDVSDIGGGALVSADISSKEFRGATLQTQNLSLDSIQGNNLPYYKIGTQRDENVGNVSYGILMRLNPADSLDAIKRQTETVTKKDDTTFTSVSKITKIKKATLIIPYRYTVKNSPEAGGQNLIISGNANNGKPLDVNVFRSDFRLQLINPSRNESQRYFVNTKASNGIDFSKEISKESNKISSSMLDNTPSDSEFLVKVTDAENKPLNLEIVKDIFEQEGRSIKVELTPNFLGNEFTEEDGKIKDISLFNSDNLMSKFRGVYIVPTKDNEGFYEVIDNLETRGTPRIEVEFERELVTTFVTESKPDPQEKDIKSENILTTSFDIETFVTDGQARIQSNLILNTIDFDEKTKTVDYKNEFNSSSIVIKGGVSVSTIDLFSNKTQLDSLFKEDVIINKALLRFKVNKSSSLYTNDESLPSSLFVTTLNGGTPLVDYNVNNISSHLIQKVPENDYYDVVITNYLKAVLGTQNIEIAREAIARGFVLGISDNNTLTTPLRLFDENKQKNVNIGNILSSKALPLYGSSAAKGNRPELIINFTTTK